MMVLMALEKSSRNLHEAMMHDYGCNGVLDGMTILSLLTATPVQIFCGRRFYINAWKGLRHGNMGMDLLVVMGTTTAFAYSLFALLYACRPQASSSQQHRDHMMMDDDTTSSSSLFFDTSAMLLTFVTLGKYLESKVKGETSKALTVLASLQPKSAVLVEGKEENEIDLTLVKTGDVLRVLPGAQVPTDGVVVEGQSYIDESMLTGEAMPVLKMPRDDVMGGTINQNGSFLMRASSVGSHTALAQIVALVHDAQLSKPPIQQYADYLASIFTPSVMGIATVAFIFWYAMAATHSIPDSWLQPHDKVSTCYKGGATMDNILVAGEGRGGGGCCDGLLEMCVLIQYQCLRLCFTGSESFPFRFAFLDLCGHRCMPLCHGPCYPYSRDGGNRSRSTDWDSNQRR